MTKKYVRKRQFVMIDVFDKICLNFGPAKSGGNGRIATIVGRSISTVEKWRTTECPPKWAYELIRLTLDERRRSYLEMSAPYRSVKNGFRFNATRLSSSLHNQYGGAAANDHLHIVQIAEHM